MFPTAVDTEMSAPEMPPPSQHAPPPPKPKNEKYIPKRSIEPPCFYGTERRALELIVGLVLNLFTASLTAAFVVFAVMACMETLDIGFVRMLAIAFFPFVVPLIGLNAAGFIYGAVWEWLLRHFDRPRHFCTLTHARMAIANVLCAVVLIVIGAAVLFFLAAAYYWIRLLKTSDLTLAMYDAEVLLPWLKVILVAQPLGWYGAMVAVHFVIGMCDYHRFEKQLLCFFCFEDHH